MSDLISVSPLLDGFQIGAAINNHCGISCYPALKEDSDRKYIVKVISIPASQSQLDALLITGAYKDPAAAAEYFHAQAENIVREADFLNKMANQGFLPFEGSQIEPMQKNRIGYDVYLLSSFRLSLERYMHRQKVTHLEAVNMGIDLCNALSACRKEGKLCISLKPANVYISNRKEFKIGDIGFAPMDSLRFLSMPEKFRSLYSAPELMDDFSVLNETVDTYAVGMMLYQIFNNGVLPQEPAKELTAPANADEEMAGIILKACNPDPKQRWNDPSEMEQALIAYMQAGTINDVPIMEPITSELAGKTGPAAFETARFSIPAALLAQQDAQPEAEEPEQAPEDSTAPLPSTEALNQVFAAPDAPQEPEAEEAAPQEEAAEAPAEEEAAAPAEEPAPAPVEEAPVPAEEPAPLPAETNDGVAERIEAAAAAEFAALTGMDDSADATPMFLDETHLDKELKELNKILKEERKPAPAAKKRSKKEANITPVVIHHEKKKNPFVRFLVFLLVLCLLGACGLWGYIFYENEYLRTIRALNITGSADEMVVTLDSDIADGLLTVICTDAYGHATRQRVRGGAATFQDLAPDSMYKVQVEINGVHKLVGVTSDVFNTESVTNVVSFTASVGANDGSAMLNLIVDGHEPEQWQVIYTAEGEPELGLTFSGHSATVNNLVLGKHYTFRLETAKHQSVNGQTSLEFTAGRVVTARDVTILSCNDGLMLVGWDSALGEAAESWIVHCYGESYDEVIECNEYQAAFSGIDSTKSYTVEVNAKGMSQIARVSISANPITMTKLNVDESNPQELKLSWDYDGAAPAGGWLVLYTLDNGNIPSVLKCEDASVSVVPRIPGAAYHFTVQAANNVTVFNNVHTYSCPTVEPYSGHGIFNAAITFRMLQTPEDADWSFYSLLSSAYTNSFVAGQSISLVLNCTSNFYLDQEDVNLLYVFRDAYGNALTELIGEQTLSWHDMWVRDDYHYAELTLPTSPVVPGEYTLEVFIDGLAAGSSQLSVY